MSVTDDSCTAGKRVRTLNALLHLLLPWSLYLHTHNVIYCANSLGGQLPLLVLFYASALATAVVGGIMFFR